MITTNQWKKFKKWREKEQERIRLSKEYTELEKAISDTKNTVVKHGWLGSNFYEEIDRAYRLIHLHSQLSRLLELEFPETVEGFLNWSLTHKK